jgi:hypothetical protein
MTSSRLSVARPSEVMATVERVGVAPTTMADELRTVRRAWIAAIET